VIIHAYNDHVRLLSPEPWLVAHSPKSTRAWEPTLSWNQLHKCALFLRLFGESMSAIAILRQLSQWATMLKFCCSGKGENPLKRLAVLILLGISCLLLGAMPLVGKKKTDKPVIETFEAVAAGNQVMTFEIQDFSTEEEIQGLAQEYAKGGADAVEGALGKVEKGRFWVHNSAHPIRIVRSSSDGGIRTLNIVAVAADRIVTGLGEHISIGHRGYPFTFVHLRIDQQGNGQGQFVPFAAIAFSKQGKIDVKTATLGSGANDTIPITHVHAVSH